MLIPCYARKIQVISSISASVAQICGRNGHNNQGFTSKFPTQRNRELIGTYQGSKSTHQGSFLPVQGRVSSLGFVGQVRGKVLSTSVTSYVAVRRSTTTMETVLAQPSSSLSS